MSGKNVAVVGGGIVGVCCAAWLQRAGHAVTLVEAGAIGEGASFGNAGNISPGAVVPYAIPGILREAPRWLLDPKGPLVIRPGYFLHVLPWLREAVKASTTEAALATSRAMRALHGGAFANYDALTRGTPAERLIERCGQLYVSELADNIRGSELVRFMREAAGVKTVPLTGDEVREVEPTLAPIFKSGLLLPDNGRCRNPLRLVQLLAEQVAGAGGIIKRSKVLGFRMHDGGAGRAVESLVLEGELLPVDRVVIAAGAASALLTAKLGTPVPLEAERGYHITIADPGVMPRMPVSHRDRSFACAPMEIGLRLAGTVEFAGLDAAPDWRRSDLLDEQARRMFPGVRMDRVTRWKGNRPSLPDGLPVLGPAPGVGNAYFAFGNSHFGISAAPTMGRVIGEIVTGDKPCIDLAPFAAERFARAR